MSRILRGLDGIEVYQDDIIIHGKDARQHDERLRKTLDVINMNGIKLNQKKCKYRQSSITFLGHRIDANGIFAHEDKIKAIVDMTAPTNVPELRSFMGMVNFMARFIPSLSTIMEPLSRLLKSDQEWTWDAQQEDAFAAVKNAMTKSTALAFYDHNRPTKLSSDASSYGLGAVILQEIDGEFRPVEYASRTLTNAERHYAQIEKELLGVVWACERFSRYLVGLDKFIIETDHKPLIPIINVKDLDGTPIRCQRLLIRLMRYNGVAQFSPGKTLVLADLLSRKPLEFDNDKDLENDVQFYVHAITSGIPASKEKIQIIQEESQKDSVICRAIKLTLEGWPNVHKVPPGLREMYHVRGSLSRPNHDMVRQRDESAKEKQAFYFDRRHGVKEMSKLQPGDTVRLKAPGEKQWGKPSVVVKPYEGNEARSYVVDTGNGEYRRNRRHIQIIPKCEIPPPDPIMVPNSGQTLIEPTEPSVNQPPEPAVVPVVNDNQNRTVQRPIRSTRGKVPERYRDFVSK